MTPIVISAIRKWFHLWAKDRPAPVWDKEAVRSILVINTTAIGDTLLTTPALRTIRMAFPKARIVALVSSAARDVLRHSPHIDQFIDHPDSVHLTTVVAMARIIATLRQAPADLAVILDGNDPYAPLFACWSGARYRVGDARSRLADLLTHRFRFDSPDVHYITLWQQHLATMGIAPQGAWMEITLSNAEAAAAEKRARQWGKPMIGLHPFASKLRDKLWPATSVVALGDLIAAAGFLPLLFGGKREAPSAEKIVAASGGRIVSVAGALTLRESMALIRQCAAFVTLDTGPMHVAQALRVPTIALFGPSDPRQTGPHPDAADAVVLQKPFECSPCNRRPCPYDVACMTAIEVPEVMAAIQTRLAGSRSLPVHGEGTGGGWREEE